MSEQNLRRIAVALERIADALEPTTADALESTDGDPDRVRDLTGELVVGLRDEAGTR